MKVLYILLILALVSCKEQPKQHDTNDSSTKDIIQQGDTTTPDIPTTIGSIDDIKQLYAAITPKLQQMDSTSFKYNCNGERQGEVKYYSENGNVKVITDSYSEYSHFSATRTYYVHDGTPYFILSDETSWSFDGMKDGESQTKDHITEKRVYIVEDKAVQCLEKKYTIRSASTDNPTPEQVANKEVECSSWAELRQSFDTLYKHRTNTSTLDCLD